MECPQFEYSPDPELERIWLQGYNHGLGLVDSNNVYTVGCAEWQAYEFGYEEGWLDS